VLQAKEYKAVKHSPPSSSIAAEQLSVPLKLIPLVFVVTHDESREVNTLLPGTIHQSCVGAEEQVVQVPFHTPESEVQLLTPDDVLKHSPADDPVAHQVQFPA